MPITVESGTDRASLADLVRAAGVRDAQAAQKADLLSKALSALRTDGVGAAEEVSAYWIPGRIEVLGKHTDYAGGRSLLAATERGFWFAAVPADGPMVSVVGAELSDRAEFPLSPDLQPPVGHWSNYPMTVARRVARNFPSATRGARIAFASDLPQASGMSSSSAMIVGFFQVLAGANSLEATDLYKANLGQLEQLAGYLGTIENGQSFGPLAGDKGVGTFGGSEDHTAILSCQPMRLNQYAYCPVRFERAVRVPADHTFAVCMSGVVAEKTGAAMDQYNRASSLSAGAVEAWRESTGSDAPHLAAAVKEAGGSPERIRDALSGATSDAFTAQDLIDRFDQFYAEDQEILPAAGDALERGDLDGFGTLVDRSQELAEKLLKNQVPETAFLARSAREIGAAAASAFGAGFGGSVWAMIRSAGATEFLKGWEEAYRAAHPAPAVSALFFCTAAGPGAFEI